MLQLKQIHKQYKTGELVQTALDSVSLNLRDNEFVAILGPSGSGKTTLLNIIGGLDRYDSGDLIINGISTREYTDRDWDSYRNHTIGFVFQSYNLIPHQTVLANVELALTISGVSKAERRRRAQAALEQVGLGNQSHKRPSEMSGGQMQRVAIARALVNNPDILLADEPTGALDSETSIQVMELLKEVAKDRLVVMVTHNPELAEQYATRIVNLKDGVIQSDTMPFAVDESVQTPPEHRNMGRASMSIFTSLALSFNNLRTKKARTLLTSFAGSIGIIGIALILSLSTGVNNYIASVERETLSEYPVQILSSGMDLTSMMTGGQEDRNRNEETRENDPDTVTVRRLLTSIFSGVNTNDLKSLKGWLDSGESGVEDYSSAIEYAYDVQPQIYRQDGDGVRQVHPDQSLASVGLGSGSYGNSMMSSMMSTNVFSALPESSDLYENQYQVKAGHWPEKYNECVLVLGSDGSVSDFLLYTLGLRDSVELDDMIKRFSENEDVTTPDSYGTYSYDDFLGITFKLVNSADCYTYDAAYGVWKDKREDDQFMKSLVANGEDITIVGVVQPEDGAMASMLSSGISYPASLVRHVVEQAKDSPIVQAQLAQPEVNVLTGKAFGAQDDGQSAFSLEDLFSVDTDALAKAFRFDQSALKPDLSGLGSLDMDTVDLSGMLDASQLGEGMPDIDMNAILSGVKLNVSSEALQSLLTEILQGYKDSIANDPTMDFSHLGQDIASYLKSEEAKAILTKHLKNIIGDNDSISVSPEALQEVIQDVMAGFEAYTQRNGLDDSSEFGEYLTEYLQADEAQQIIREGAKNVLSVDSELEISDDELNALASDLLAGYQSYAAANGLADPSKLTDSFTDYINTPEGQQKLLNGVMGMMDTSAVEQQFAEAMTGYAGALQSQVGSVMESVMAQLSTQIENALTNSFSGLEEQMQSAFHVDADAFANAIQVNMDESELEELMSSLMSARSATYASNLSSFGYADFSDPSQISIYPKDFESKAQIISLLDDYNQSRKDAGQEDKMIRYTDLVGTMMSSVTDIVNMISYVLVAFVAISLIVSSIMIGVITYISVMERRKEIGILRAIGASKRNISEVFNAETFIIGLCAGLLGVILTELILIPGNAVIRMVTDAGIHAALPPLAALVLILLSTLLTMIGGFIPSKSAARSNPVTALRSE